jgi:carbamate kinase
MEKVTLSFGGNALGITHDEQIKNAKIAAKVIVDVSLANNVLVVTGNGPISGNLSLGLDYAKSEDITKSTYSLANIVAMTQGSIGSDFEMAILNELKSRGIKKNVTCILTHIIVDENDQKFNDPTKPIGAFYNESEVETKSRENN